MPATAHAEQKKRSRKGLPQRVRGVAAQYTTDPTVIPSASALAAIAGMDTSVKRFAHVLGQVAVASGEPDREDFRILCEIRDRKGQLEAEQARLRSLFRRFDNLFYAETITEPGGADHWPEGRKPGRVHISLNAAAPYVVIPASLQAVTPVENYVAADASEEERDVAARAERLYFQWKEDADFELEVHKACVVKALYGHTFVKVYWDERERIPRVMVLDQPENLYVGWGDSDYRRMDWTIYAYGISPMAAEIEYGVKVLPVKAGGNYYPVVTSGTHDDPLGTVNFAQDFQNPRIRSAYEEQQVEVYDYWYRKPGKRRNDPPEIWNAIFVGNQIVEHARHSEYDDLPYIPLTNDYVPGSPYGRPELLDLEQLFREKDERLTEAAQMIHSVIEGQMWQLVGPDTTDEVPPNVVPKPNKVIAPGAGAEIKAIQPFVPQFAVEDYLKRIDAELESISGLNDLLIGRAPATILGSSKAITALVANYEARIRMKRALLYEARRRMWSMAATMWEDKDDDIAEILDGRHRLRIIEPELTPRDQLENAQKAINLINSRVWSLRRGMDATGVEDPEEEINLIRQEQTDPALNPASVQAQVSLAAGMQALGVGPESLPGTPTQNQTENSARTLNRAPAGTSSLNGPENEGQTAPEAQPANARGSAMAQTLVQDGEATGRIITQAPIGG